ncbi:MAG: methyltransferase domain-containing protein [Dehalococcoidia bacterium]
MTRWQESTKHLYDHVDDWLTKYGADANQRLQPRRDGASGEERFTELVQQHVRPRDTVVDIGTGDAGWLMKNIAPHVGRAVGFDYAARRLWHGAQERDRLAAKNVDLLLADGRRIPMRDGAADAIINRRGPWTYDDDFMREGVRILRPGGLGVEISIGEQNGRELEDAFDERSQMHEWYASAEARIDTVPALYRRFGLEVLVAESYVCKEVFASREAFFFRLETTPAIDDFDPEVDTPLVDRVIERCATNEGPALTVHRLCFVGRKVA